MATILALPELMTQLFRLGALNHEGVHVGIHAGGCLLAITCAKGEVHCSFLYPGDAMKIHFYSANVNDFSYDTFDEKLRKRLNEVESTV